jgi:hypothetical protein
MEQRGADVVAVDNWDNPRFREMHALLGSRVKYRQFDMYELTPETVGRFDIVLFMGVLYHLKHPLLALERVCALATEMAAIDSFILRDEHRPGEEVKGRPIMEFYETDEFGGQTDNWIGPTLSCLLAMCRAAGFARVEQPKVLEYGACVTCYRNWQPPPSGATNGPELLDAVHDGNYGINFKIRLDEYVSAWFNSDVSDLALNDVKPEVGGYGVRPLLVRPVAEGQWMVKFKLPPGLKAGWHEVSLRIGDSLPSNSKRIAVDIPPRTDVIRLAGLRDAQSWVQNELDLSLGRTLALWVAGLPLNADRNNLHVFLNGRKLRIEYIDGRDDIEPRQVNVEVPPDTLRGSAKIVVEINEQPTRPEEINIL